MVAKAIVSHPFPPGSAGRAEKPSGGITNCIHISRPMRLNRPPPRLRPISPSGSGYLAARCPLHSAQGIQYMHHTLFHLVSESPVGKGSDVLPPSIIPFSPANDVGNGPRLNRIRTVVQRHFTARLGIDGMTTAVIGCCGWSDAQSMQCIHLDSTGRTVLVSAEASECRTETQPFSSSY